MSLTQVPTELLQNFIITELDQVSSLALRWSCKDMYNRVAPSRNRAKQMPKMNMEQLLRIEQWQIYDKRARGRGEAVTVTTQVAQAVPAKPDASNTAVGKPQQKNSTKKSALAATSKVNGQTLASLTPSTKLNTVSASHAPVSKPLQAKHLQARYRDKGLDIPAHTSEDAEMSVTLPHTTKVFEPIPAPYASTLPTTAPSYFACQHCLKLHPTTSFSNKNTEGARGKGPGQADTNNKHDDRANRFCIPCGVKKKKYRMRTEISFGGTEPEAGLGVVCSKCKKFKRVHELYEKHVEWKRQRWCGECCLEVVQERLGSGWRPSGKWKNMREEGHVKNRGIAGRKRNKAKKIKEEGKIRDAKKAKEAQVDGAEKVQPKNKESTKAKEAQADGPDEDEELADSADNE